MKKIVLFSFAFASLVACNHEEAKAPKPGSPVEVTVAIKGASAQTKATDVVFNGASSEAKVNTLQVFVFNGDDREAYKSVTESSALVPATSGDRTIWAVVNAPSLESVMTMSGLKAATSSLSDNGLSNFVMAGSVAQELSDGGIVNVTVRRMVSRVSIGRVSTALTDYRENFKVDIKGISLVNVPANGSYDQTADPTVWANKLAHNSAAYDMFLYDGFASPVRIYNNHPYVREHVFYTYPNTLPTTASPDDYSSPSWSTWSPRGTMLVLDVDMLKADGSLYKSGYYPIALPAMERNKTYVIEEVRISRIPGDNPFEPIVVGEACVTITVKDWETGSNLGTIDI
jgi:phosphohistidine swiveling domain-containing protein